MVTSYDMKYHDISTNNKMLDEIAKKSKSVIVQYLGVCFNGIAVVFKGIVIISFWDTQIN